MPEGAVARQRDRILPQDVICDSECSRCRTRTSHALGCRRANAAIPPRHNDALLLLGIRGRQSRTDADRRGSRGASVSQPVRTWLCRGEYDLPGVARGEVVRLHVVIFRPCGCGRRHLAGRDRCLRRAESPDCSCTDRARPHGSDISSACLWVTHIQSIADVLHLPRWPIFSFPGCRD